MTLCYSRTPSGKALWYSDPSGTELETTDPDLYTTFNPYNADVILSYMDQNMRVVACSDQAIDDALATEDPSVMFDAMVGIQDGLRSGFRYLTKLDRLHLRLQLQWQQPGFRFSQAYLQRLIDVGLVDSHPLTAYAQFLDLSPVYCMAVAAMWLDPHRWDIVPGNVQSGQTLLEDALGLEGPSPTMHHDLVRRQPMCVLNDHTYSAKARGWLLLHGCWSSVLSDALENRPNSRLSRLYQEVTRHARGCHPRSDFERVRDVRMTQVVTRYLLVHHKSIVRGATSGYCEEGWASLNCVPDLACEYVHHFSSLQFQ